MITKKKILFLLSFFLLCSYSFGQNNTREIININEDWLYLEKNITSFDTLVKEKDSWESINLPHTWNQWDATDNLPGYRRDTGWYKKTFFIPKENYSRYILYFEGANITTTVFVNKKFVGEHIGGYVGFEFDITKFITKKSENTIFIKVDNSVNREIIPSQKSDFFIYGGITRDVWLKKLPQLSISNIQVLTPQVSKIKAVAKVKLKLFNSANRVENTEVTIQIKGSSNKLISSTKKSIENNSRETFLDLTLPEIKNPKLWSPNSPVLYTVNVLLKQNGVIIDSTSQNFGLRWYEFKEHGAFFLNGERLLLRGTHRHEEWAGYGAAMPNKLHRKDIEMIKEMGANFIRLAHYPQDPEVYKTCDELGLLLWDELPWCRGGLGNNKWKENTTNLLEEQINQNINHPSIILWSMGNEIYWEPDFDGGENRDSINIFLTKLNNLAHKLDPTRLTSIRKYYEGADIIDVFSPSIWAGWYSGVYKNYKNSILDAQKKYNKFFHAEYGGASHLGRHSENSLLGNKRINKNGWEEKNNQVKTKNIAKTSDWNENYIVDLFDWHLHISEQLENFTGNAQWAFKDFGTPLRPENPIPFVNQKGLVDRDGNPKDAYYVFKSYWNTKDKFCYIESHTWEERRAEEGEKLDVSVYSNCEEVDFILNGKSLGRKTKSLKKFPACGLSWDMIFNEGENYLSAIGYVNGQKVTQDNLTINFSTQPNSLPTKIKLSTKKLATGNKIIEALVIDKDGKRCLDYNKKIYFSMNGNGKLLFNYGTPTRSQVIEAANGKAEIEFVPIPDGKATIEVRNQDFKGSYIIIE